MSSESRETYRSRIYGSYVTARDQPLAPETVAGFGPRLPYFRRMMSRYFPADKNAAILELGCGHGALVHTLQQAGFHNVRGVDGSPQQVDAARRMGIAGVKEGLVLDALRAETDASLDVVIAFDVIEHFSKDELIALVDEVVRVLRPGGRWIIHVPNAEAPFGSRMRHWDFTHEVAFTRVSLGQLLKASGFSDVMCYEDRPVPHGVKSTVRAALWSVIRVGLLLYTAIETGSTERDAIFSQNLLAVAVRGAS